MSFSEVQFPTDISFGSAGGPGFLTDIIVLDSGREKRVQRWSQSRGRWNVGYGIKTIAQLQTVLTFFNARCGRAYGWRFKDWLNYQGTAEVIGTGDDNEDTFQLVKLYTSGSDTYSKDITKPVSGTTQIFFDEVEQESGWSVDTTTGIVTFSSPPGAGVEITATFEFDTPARFDIDTLAIALEDFGGGNVPTIPVVEIRL